MLRPLHAPRRGLLTSETCRRTGLTARAIRFYEEQGLLTSERGSNDQRMFNESAVDRLAFIAEARAVGLSVREVRDLLRIGDVQGPEAQRERLRESCVRRLDELAEQKRLVEKTLSGLGGLSAPARLRVAS